MRAHIFDMDGTLLIGTSAPVLVAEALGRSDFLVELEDRFSAGTATAVDFARVLNEMWGVVPAEVARRAFAAAPLLANIREVVADIHRRGERACMITMSPDYFAEQFLEFGFDSVFASRFPRSAELVLDEAAILDPEAKPRLAARFCDEHGLELSGAVAYGDSMSDVFLFREAGLRVSVNGDHHLAELADIAVEGVDLMVAYSAARRWCDQASS
jgi:phosphoserine phosphatase